MDIIENCVEKWHDMNKIKKLFGTWRDDTQKQKKKLTTAAFIKTYNERRILQNGLRMMRWFTQVYGNRMHERRMKERVTLEVKGKVEEM